MELMKRRRELMMQNAVLDTSPRIAETGKACAWATTGERDASDYSITEYYIFDSTTVGVITLYYDATTTGGMRECSYQFSTYNYGKKDWHYSTSNSDHTRRIGWNGFAIYRIRFSVPNAQIDDVAAYCVDTGQILFAGKNSIYYGHRNINELS